MQSINGSFSSTGGGEAAAFDFLAFLYTNAFHQGVVNGNTLTILQFQGDILKAPADTSQKRFLTFFNHF